MITRRLLLQGAGAALPFALGALPHAWAEAAAAPALGTLRAVTITAPDLTVVEKAWTQFLGYKVVRRGTISAGTAASWDAPAVKGKPYIVLGPESGEPTYVRFVQQALPKNFDGGRTLGWTTTEITVQNSDELYEKLKGSPFKVGRPPQEIPTYPYLKAMQAVGPAGERLNLTWIKTPRDDLAVANSFVGRVFIAVLAAPNIRGALDHYKNTFGNEPSGIRNLPSLTLATVLLKDGTKLEVDDAPQAPQRPRPSGGLPPGVAVVTFESAGIDRFRDHFIKPAQPATLEPHRTRPTATLRGPAGELIELVEV
jgi:hypothetical protein